MNCTPIDLIRALHVVFVFVILGLIFVHSGQGAPARHVEACLNMRFPIVFLYQCCNMRVF